MKALAVLLAASAFQPDIPKTWDDRAVAVLEVPLANPKYSPIHISEAAYYQIPPRVIYKSYPVYHPSREPAGYMDWLKKQEPEVAFDPSKLKTREDWVKAGELVFNAPTSYSPVFFSAADLRDPAFYEKTGMPVASGGVIPFARWVVRRKGEVELGSMGCNTCHTRVMADGTVVPGAQGNNPGDREGAWMLRRAAQAGEASKVLARIRGFARQFEMPWLPDDPNRRAQAMSLDELLAAGEAIPPGVTARSNTSMFLPPQIPDLIGVRERRYLDHTGLVRHRGIGDLMRYSSLVQDMVALDRYGDAPPPKLSAGHSSRYSDEQLYALALYLYSLQPPPNPNRFDATAERGKQIFSREGCAACHTPPLYTNNKLIPVDGFEPPAEHRWRFDIMEARIGTDPRYALETHKGTGYYKVPSLKGVWYRGPFEHNGSAATLEDWFDPARLRADYVPTGFKGYDGKTRRVKGHRFGLDLSPEEKKALIAFLKTL
jgi:mono/diheme cytochrome c family protein